MKRILCLIAALALLPSLPSFATLYTTNWTSGWDNGQVVPDNSHSGWTDSRTLDAAPAGTVTPGSVAVTLNLSGGWNGDLYAYLVNSGGGFSVLLNRVGMGEPGVGAYGYGDAGMTVTLAATGTSIHQYGGGSTFTAPPTGTWAADGGNLGSFLSQGGTWTLFIADLSSGGVTTVQGWGLQMDIVAVPEVETWVAAALAGAFGAFWLNRQIWGPRKS
jgi:subtilisin-like proprotein convertase family protein